MILLRKGKLKTFPPFETELHIPGRTHIQETGKEVVVEESVWDGSQPMKEFHNVAYLDCEQLHLPLRMRNFRPGDRFQPLGAKGTQKLKEFFIDHKVPKFERHNIPLLISGERIAWVVGYRIDERFKITSHTQKVLKVEIV
jgi:tRNA(Ile)-lysidine synthase